MADVINEGDSKIEVIDSGAAGAAQITAVLNNVERADITSTLISFYNPSDQMETGNATAGELYFVVSYIQNANVS